jgi:hypothetical protein
MKPILRASGKLLRDLENGNKGKEQQWNYGAGDEQQEDTIGKSASEQPGGQHRQTFR